MKPASINLNKIDKSALISGKNGNYLAIVLFENKDGTDQYGNAGFITQDIGKERREAGEKGPIIGNYRELQARPQNQQQSRPAPKAAQLPAQDDDVNDDIPF